jgi:hypothetical protein
VARVLLFSSPMHSSLRLVSILASISFAACTAGGGDDGGDDAATRVTGQGVYRDSATAHDGNPQEPASPEPQPAEVTLVVEGTGTIPEVDPQCALDPAGSFQATFDGTMTLSDSGAYVAALAEGSGSITTPSGCEIPDLTVGVVTSVTLRASIQATTQNCETYCAASARADAEAECGASADAAECRATFEAQAAASCTTECTSQDHHIVAELSLGANALGEVDADTLRAAAMGELTADLTFDTLE